MEASPPYRVLILLIELGIVLASVAGFTSASHGSKEGPLGPASVVFPTSGMGAFENASSLAAYLGQILQLNMTEPLSWIQNPTSELTCCVTDWNGRTIPVLRETEILAVRNGSPTMTFVYSQNRKLISASVVGYFGALLQTGSTQEMSQRLESIAGLLGLSIFARESEVRNSAIKISSGEVTAEHRAVSVASTSNYTSLPVAFGNQLWITFDVDRAMAEGLYVFPWFSAPTPSVSSGQAYVTAMDFLNRTMNDTLRDQSGGVWLAFDSIHYALAYQVEIRASSQGSSNYRNYRLWVDAYDGTVVYSVEIPPTFSGQPAPSPLGWYLLITSFLASGVILSAAIVFFDPLRFGVVLALLPLYSRLRQGKALEHFVRGQVYGYVVSHPGATFGEVRDAFSLKNGSTTYHLAVLVALGFLKAVSDGARKCFYPAGVESPPLGRNLTDLHYRMLDILRESGRAGPSEMAAKLGISKQRAAYNLRKLAELEVLSEDPDHHGKYKMANEVSPQVVDEDLSD